jgi:hypothetical protein
MGRSRLALTPLTPLSQFGAWGVRGVRAGARGGRGVRGGLPLQALLLGLLVLGCAFGCGRGPGAQASSGGSAAGRSPAPFQFTEIASAAGIAFRHESGASGRLYLPETMGPGCAMFDADGDGKLDLFLVNGKALPGSTARGPFYPALYRNLGEGAFEDVTRASGLVTERYGLGVAVGDYDNDGRLDLYLTALDGNLLFRNRGNGRFEDVTRRAGVTVDAFSTTAAWIDFDRDGRLDLFVGNYCEWSPERNQVCPDSFGRRHLCPPDHYRGVPSRLFRNEGDGRFTDVTRRAGLWQTTGKTLGLLVWDFNDDGWPDLMLANDLEPNLLYRNNRNGTFTEMGVEAGVAYSAAGKARAGMGIDSADLDGDGREAVLIGNGTTESLALFRRGAGDGLFFADDAGTAGLAVPSLPFLTFGVLFADFDLDGRKDLLTANGHIDPNVAVIGGEATFPQRMLLFRNEPGEQGRAIFREVGSTAGPALAEARLHRGLAAGDVDDDGDLDVLVSVCGGAPLLLRNEARRPGEPGGGHWLTVRLIGVKSNRAGIGARLLLRAGGVSQASWVRSGSSYASQSDLRAYFGLGDATRVDSLEVRWPSGHVQSLTNLPVDRQLVIREPDGPAPGAVPTRADDG